MVIVLKFKDGKTIEIKEYSTFNIQRTGRHTDINITNTENDFAFSTLYDRVIALQGSDGTFDITLQAPSGKEAGYPGFVADYYYSGDNEILHFTTKDR